MSLLCWNYISSDVSVRKYRSDNMRGYLTCLQAQDEMIDIHISRERESLSRNAIQMHPDRVVIAKATVANRCTETLPLGVEIVTDTERRETRSFTTLISPGNYSGFVTTTVLTMAAEHDIHLVEHRQLMGDGREHSQIITINNLTTEESSVTRRVWRRVA